MKNNLSVQLFADSKNTGNKQSSFTGVNNKLYHLFAPDRQKKPIGLQEAVINFTGNTSPVKINFPTKEITIRERKNPVLRINGDEVTLQPYFKPLLKETAIHLSNIDMAVENYDLSGVPFDTLALKCILFNMGMPETCRHIEQMEYMAKENNLKQVSRSLLELKKIIAQIVQQNQLLNIQ